MSGLWPHQLKAMEQVRTEFRAGHKWICVVMSTGAGKTRFGGETVIQHSLKSPKTKKLWIAHREELVSQAYDELTGLGLSCGVIQANPSRPVNPNRPVQVASVQTLIARGLVVSDVSLFVYDECHHGAAGTWSKQALQYKTSGAYGIGLTATPVRADGKPLGDIFDSLVCPITMRELIEQGFLVPYELVRPRRPLAPGTIAQTPVDAYKKHAMGRQTIVFASNVLSARLFRDQFLAAGIPCEIITGEMASGERRKTLDKYKTGAINVLVNCSVLTEGFDDRPTSCAILARSVGSISLYLQMCGRALRTSLKTGKINAILIDLYGSSHNHQEPDAERSYSLDGEGISCGKPAPLGPERFCVLCGCTLDGDATICPECGTLRPGQVPPEVVNAELIKYAWMRQRPPEQRAASLRRWLEDARTKGHKEGRAMHKYRTVFGDWPPADILRQARTN